MGCHWRNDVIKWKFLKCHIENKLQGDQEEARKLIRRLAQWFRQKMMVVWSLGAGIMGEKGVSEQWLHWGCILKVELSRIYSWIGHWIWGNEKKNGKNLGFGAWVTRRMGFAIYSGRCHCSFGFIGGEGWCWINGSWSLNMLSLRCFIDVQVEEGLSSDRLYKFRSQGVMLRRGFGEVSVYVCGFESSGSRA